MRVIFRFLMSLAIEFGPVVVFFAAAQYMNFYAATGALIAATFLALVAALLRDQRIPYFAFISSAFVLLFGFVTIAYGDPFWIQFEYTLYNAVFGVAIIAALPFDKSLLKPLFQSTFLMSDRGWKILSFRWALFFLATAAGNEYFLRFASEAAWVRYRFGAAIVLCIFGFSQFFLARRHRLPHASPWGLKV